jgi:hypothetical protein
VRTTHSSSTPTRCKPAPENSLPDTIQPRTQADRARRVAALRAALSAPAFQAKVQSLRSHESASTPALPATGLLARECQREGN